MTAPDARELRMVLDELANALQGAVGMAALLRRQAQTTTDDVIRLEDAITRSAAALRRLQPPRDVASR
jgi:hypothetical protein